MIVVTTIIPQNRIKHAQTCATMKKTVTYCNYQYFLRASKRFLIMFSCRGLTQTSSAFQPKLIVCFDHLMEWWASASQSRKSCFTLLARWFHHEEGRIKKSIQINWACNWTPFSSDILPSNWHCGEIFFLLGLTVIFGVSMVIESVPDQSYFTSPDLLCCWFIWRFIWRTWMVVIV